jgi:hypothetical protein
MALPKIKTKYHTTTLFSNDKKKIKFRPFTIGEQKNIMMVRETTDDIADVYKAIAQLTNECVEGIDVLDLYTVDFEKIFYDMKTVADGSVLPFTLECMDKECGHKSEGFEINVQNDFKLSSTEFETILDIKEAGIKVHVRQPKLKDNFTIESKTYKNDDEKALDLMVHCISKVVQGEQVFTDFTFKEAKEFFNSLPQGYLDKLVKFFSNTPSITTDKQFFCEKCNKEIILNKNDIKLFL